MLTALVAAFLLTAPVHAKDPCKGVSFEEDPFTHQKVATVPGAVWSISWILGWEASYNAGETAIKFKFPVSGVHDEVLPAGYTVKLLQEDGTVIDLVTTEPTQPAPGASSSGVYTTWLAVFPLNPELLSTLAAQPITAVRATLPGGDVTWNAGGRYQKMFTKAFGCFASVSGTE